MFLWVNKLSTSSFFLKGKLGESSWQPGPNQVFETLEDVRSMVVFSIWEKKKETTETSYEEKVLELTSTVKMKHMLWGIQQ